MVMRDEFLEFSSKLGSISGAFAVGADGDLEIASPDRGGDVEVAQIGDVNDVAEDLERFAVIEYLLIEVLIVCCGDHECGAFNAFFFVALLADIKGDAFEKLFEMRVDLFGDDGDLGLGVDERSDFGDGEGACTDNDGSFSSKIQIYRILSHA